MKSNLRSRRGLSLTEVLVSIFILSIGLMSLMSLFPIGALQMAQAMKDDRSSQAAGNAERLFRVWWKEAWLDDGTGRLNDNKTVWNKQPGFQGLDDWNIGSDPPANASTTLGTVQALNPTGNKKAPNSFLNYPTSFLTDAATYPNVSAEGSTGEDLLPGYPVLLDPIGIATNNANNRKFWVGGVTTGANRIQIRSRMVPRRDIRINSRDASYTPFGASTTYSAAATGGKTFTLGSSSAAQARYTCCSLLDDLTFDPSGGAKLSGGNAVERGGGNSESGSSNYNYSWMIQRPRNNVRQEVNLQVLVYRRRPASDVPNAETMYGTITNNGAPSVTCNFCDVILTPNSNIVTLQSLTTVRKPAIRRNSWIMNASQFLVTETPPGVTLASDSPPNKKTTRYTRQLADFYRVVGTSERTGTNANGAAVNLLDIELQTPLRKYPVNGEVLPSGVTRTVPQFNWVIVTFDNLVEVFDRGTISAFDKPAP